MVDPDAVEARLIKKGVAKLKKLLWADFTLWVKLSGSDDGITVPCYTCDATLQIGTPNCQGGHWLPKSANSIYYFDERNVKSQCWNCNLNLSGNSEEFRLRLIKEYGEDVIQEMSDTRMMLEKRSRGWYVDKIIYYRAEIEDMQAQ